MLIFLTCNITKKKTTTNKQRNYTPEPNAICQVEGLNADPTDCAVYYQCESYAANGWIVYTERCTYGAGILK